MVVRIDIRARSGREAQNELFDMVEVLNLTDKTYQEAVTESRNFENTIGALRVVAYNFYYRYMDPKAQSLDWKMNFDRFFKLIETDPEELEEWEEYSKYKEEHYKWFKDYIYGFVTGLQLLD